MYKPIFTLVFLTCCYLVSQPFFSATARGKDGDALKIISWGGAYQISQERAYFKPFNQSTAIEITTHVHKNDGKGVIVALENNPAWDIADLTSKDEQEACKKGLIKPLDIGKILAEDDVGQEDLLPGAIAKCGIGSVAWSSVLVSNRRKFRNRQPKSVADFFNLKRFPGKRALPKGPKYLLELALMADGVPAAEVYNALDAVEGVARAFEKLETLRGQIIWWEQAGEPLKILEDGRAVMVMAYNGRAFIEITARMHPFDIIWDGQIYDIDYWVISKKSAHVDQALKFIRFAIGADRLAAQASWFPYGPMRKSAVAMVDKHAQLDLKMAPYLPTNPDNMKNALRLNTKWWADNETRLVARFQAWLKEEGAQDEQAEKSQMSSE